MKNFTNHFISNLTQGFQMLQNSFLDGFVHTTFAFLNGRVNVYGLMKGALLLTAISPLGTLAAGIAMLDFRVGYDYELRNAIHYLNFTAAKIDELERTLSWKARGI